LVTALGVPLGAFAPAQANNVHVAHTLIGVHDASVGRLIDLDIDSSTDDAEIRFWIFCYDDLHPNALPVAA